jgi:hypothetical protein
MTVKVQVELEEVMRVFRFLEKAHELMHQPMTYRAPGQVIRFIDENYPEVRALYYEVVWGWIPERTRADIEDGGDGGRGAPG